MNKLKKLSLICILINTGQQFICSDESVFQFKALKSLSNTEESDSESIETKDVDAKLISPKLSSDFSDYSDCDELDLTLDIDEDELTEETKPSLKKSAISFARLLPKLKNGQGQRAQYILEQEDISDLWTKVEEEKELAALDNSKNPLILSEDEILLKLDMTPEEQAQELLTKKHTEENKLASSLTPTPTSSKFLVDEQHDSL